MQSGTIQIASFGTVIAIVITIVGSAAVTATRGGAGATTITRVAVVVVTISNGRRI